jgi:glycosyltransferase involved in cell wall biosynthesis
MPSTPRVVVAHDYFTQRGGAERVALALRAGLGTGPIVTSVVHLDTTFVDLSRYGYRTSWLQRFQVARRDPRLVFPLLPRAWSGLHVGADEADVVLVSSTGFAHGVSTDVPKLVYCHNPPRWLYQPEDYLLDHSPHVRPALAAAAPYLRRWDQRAARSAVRYLANSTATAQRIRAAYGIEPFVVHPPVAIDADGPQEPVAGIEAGFLLLISRPRGYKNIAVACEALELLPGERLVVVGGLPEGNANRRIRALAGISDAQLRWLYAHCRALVAPSYEDFGLTPVEAASFGKPTVALRAGGYLDTVVEDVTGVYADAVKPSTFSEAIKRLDALALDPAKIRQHADRFSLPRFLDEVGAHVSAVAG